MQIILQASCSRMKEKQQVNIIWDALMTQPDSVGTSWNMPASDRPIREEMIFVKTSEDVYPQEQRWWSSASTSTNNNIIFPQIN